MATTGSEEIGNLGHWHEISDVRLSRRCRAPVDIQVSLLEDLVDRGCPKDFLEIPRNQRISTDVCERGLET